MGFGPHWYVLRGASDTQVLTLQQGNIQVDAMHLGSPAGITVDKALPDDKIQASFDAWAKASRGDGNTPTVVQINHPGRQSPMGAGKRGPFAKAIAPSALPMDLGPGLIARAANRIIFGTPRAMTVADIKTVVGQFVRAARFVADAGFDGIQIHAAHGYLLAQFLSAASNHRTDEYGGTPENRARIVVEIIHAIKAVVGEKKNFCVGIKLNSVDHQSQDELRSCISQLRLITDAGVDFVEISGGTYENPLVSSE